MCFCFFLNNVFMFFSKLFYFGLFLYVFFDCKCTSLNRLGKNINKQNKKQKQNRKASRKTFKHNINTGYPAHEPPRIYIIYLLERGKKKKQKNIISQPEPERYLFAVGSRAGYPVFPFVLMFFFLEAFQFFFLCLILYVFVMFSPSLFKCFLNATQYTTLNTNKLEMGLFMTCVKSSK